MSALGTLFTVAAAGAFPIALGEFPLGERLNVLIEVGKGGER